MAEAERARQVVVADSQAEAVEGIQVAASGVVVAVGITD